VSTVSLNHGAQRVRNANWARLIPGYLPDVNPGKKRPQSVKLLPVRVHGFATSADARESGVAMLVPRPLQSRMGLPWMWSMAADFGFVALSWMLVGGALTLIRALPVAVRWLQASEVAVASLLGFSVLHATLITLFGYSEGLRFESMSLAKQGYILGKSVVWATAVLSFAYGMQGAPWFIHGLFCGAGVLGFGALWTWRWWSAERIRGARGGSGARNVLIVGAGDVGRRVAAQLGKHPTGRVVCGFLDDQAPIGGEILGRARDLARMARERFVDEVILAAPQNNELTRWVVEEARQLRLDVEIVPDLLGCRSVAPDVERVGGWPVICVHAERLPAIALLLKRVVDVVGAAIALVLLSPLLSLIAILIKVDSRGAVLYCADRGGRKGRLFRCYKFRTMVSNADELKDQLRCNNEREGPFFKVKADPRITRVGRYLRRYSLDELPQFWNVLMGHMSLVGPRPHPLDDVAGYEIEHLARLDVTPGLTGLWQVTARRDPSFRRGMELDREYIRRWSLGLDLKILLRTVQAVVCGSGE
jgi:exopolysaccharide biosynthesis polyprenyl glycosylphosphotransferase